MDSLLLLIRIVVVALVFWIEERFFAMNKKCPGVIEFHLSSKPVE